MTDLANITIPFAERVVKIASEEYNASLVTQKGGWFGLTGIEIGSHFSRFGGNLRTDSPFVAIEQDDTQFNKLKERALALPSHQRRHVKIFNNDLFTQLRLIKEHRPDRIRVPLFSYGHLDFCTTAVSLLKTGNLQEGLEWLSHWKDLKNEFMFDITFSTRNDRYETYKMVMNWLIPFIFSTSGWHVTNPKRRCNDFVHRYKEPGGAPMVNALYKVVRRKPGEHIHYNIPKIV